MKREYTQLAHVYDPAKHMIAGWILSEKLDGMRALWDGGWSRGILCSQVPYANTEKDYCQTRLPYATGLWSRYGNAIYAPDSFLDALPKGVMLDGELYLGTGRFQELMSVVRRHQPDLFKWMHVRYHVFDLPSDYMFLSNGKVNNPNCHVCFENTNLFGFNPQPRGFKAVSGKLARDYSNHPVISVVEQYQLPNGLTNAQEEIDHHLTRIIDGGGEGVMLRKPESIWEPKRTTNLLKVKPYDEGKAFIVGYVGGRGHLTGLLGSLIVTWGTKTFDIRGGIRKDQCLLLRDGLVYTAEPGERMTDVNNEIWSLGNVVNFRYRGLTNDGYPKEARITI